MSLTFVNIDISSEQLKNLVTAPVELIPFQGPNTFIVINSVVMKYTYGTTSYTGGNGSLQVIWNNDNLDTPLPMTTLTEDILLGSSNALIVVSGASGTNWYQQYPITACIDTGIILYSSSNYADGDGTARFCISYSVAEL